MAASDVAICNLSLAHLADRANVNAITPPDGTYQAEQCARFYPIARDQLLESFPWTFAKTRVQLVQLAITPPGQWGYTYAYPANCLRTLSLQIPGALDDNKSEKFLVEKDPTGPNRVIYCNIQEAHLRYIAADASVGSFTPGFVVTLSWLLASYLAGPITKSLKMKADAFKVAVAEYTKATALDANAEETQVYLDHTPAWIAGRA